MTFSTPRFQRKKPDIVTPNSEKDIRSTVLQSVRLQYDAAKKLAHFYFNPIGSGLAWGGDLVEVPMAILHFITKSG